MTKYFEHLHPVCIFLYFVLVIGMTLACMHPVMLLISATGAALFLWMLGGRRKVVGILRFVGPMFLLIAIANPLVNHRGVTLLACSWISGLRWRLSAMESQQDFHWGH